jgi:hypothetical protein
MGGLLRPNGDSLRVVSLYLRRRSHVRTRSIGVANRAGQARISLFNVVSGWLIGSIVINHDPAWPA